MPTFSLFDPQGALVAKDDDSGGDYNARILFDPKASGQYRLLAADFPKADRALFHRHRQGHSPQEHRRRATAVDRQTPRSRLRRRGSESRGRASRANPPSPGPPTARRSSCSIAEGWLRASAIRNSSKINVCRSRRPSPDSFDRRGAARFHDERPRVVILDPQNLQLKRRLPQLGNTCWRRRR